MTNIITTLKSMSEEDRKVYCHLRMTLHRAYLWAIEQTIGIAKMDMEDDVFLDALDIKLNMLMRRAGRSHSKDTPTNDPFEVVSRSVETEYKQTENSISKAAVDMIKTGWKKPTEPEETPEERHKRLMSVDGDGKPWSVEKVGQVKDDQNHINLKSLERAISQENTNV